MAPYSSVSPGDGGESIGASRSRAFLAAKSLSELGDKPLRFEKDDGFNTYACVLAQVGNLSAACVPALFCPIGTCAPCVMFKHYSLEVDHDAVSFATATNDCCCHIAKVQKTVPLQVIQDVQLQTNCCLSCFGLQRVVLETAATGGPGAEVAAEFLAHPELVRDVLKLAAKLKREAIASPPGQQAGMSRVGGGAAGGEPANALHARLELLSALVKVGTLSSDEATALRVAALAAQNDAGLQHLREAGQLAAEGLVSGAEFARLKAAIVAQLEGRVVAA